MRHRRTSGRGRGQPAPAADRGTVLLMVLGVLALMAIMAVVYVTIGRADRTMTAALMREQRLDDQAEQIKDWIAGIIARDRFGSYSQQTESQPVLRTEVFDYPDTDPRMASQAVGGAFPGQTANNFYYRFDPTGNYTELWSQVDPDPRRPTDPWLASIEPQDLLLDVGDIPSERFLFHRRHRRQISIISPTGQFVNLHGIRNNFDAEPGFERDSAGRPRMSTRLSLFHKNTREPMPPVPVGQDPEQDYTFPDGTVVRLNRPYSWARDQMWAFRPAVDEVYKLSDPGWLGYQWADVDGDGFIDSRWTELVDIRDPNRPRWILPSNGSMRYFLACQVQDLSGQVNVNTASDLWDAPKSVRVTEPSDPAVFYTFPLGMTPADVDLLRLLRLRDLREVGSLIDTDGGFAWLLPEQNPRVSYGDYTEGVATATGELAYRALLEARAAGVLPAPDASSNWALPHNASVNERFNTYDRFSSALSGVSRGSVHALLGLESELELKTFHGVNDDTRTSRLELVFGGRNPAYTTLSPLRENRPRLDEMAGRDVDPAAIDDDVHAIVLYGMHADLRRLLTTVSGASPIIDPLTIDPERPSFQVRYSLNRQIELLQNHLPTEDERRAATRAAAGEFFQQYADCLAPYTHRDQFPNAWDLSTAGARTRFASYGGSAEFALRTAMTMAVNAVDAIDRDGDTGSDPEPTVVTLQISETDPNENIFPKPWEAIPKDRRPPNDALIKGSRYLNLFGVDAQPFLTQATSIQVYVDAPPNVPGADDEFGEALPGPGGEVVDPEVTINVTRDLDLNPDFLFEVLAFQITNPFDSDIILQPAGGADLGNFYYFEYAGHTYRVAHAQAGFTLGFDLGREVRLGAGQTMVLYTTSPASVPDLEGRVQRVLRELPGATIPTFSLENWAKQQFGHQGGPDPVLIARVDPTTGYYKSGDFDPLNEADATVDRKTAFLWRVRRPLESTTESISNLLDNDYLVDRLRDPSTVSEGVLLASRPTPGTVGSHISGTRAGDDSGAGDPEDNSGYSIAFTARFQRPTGPRPPEGGLGPWTLEAKLDNGLEPASPWLNIASTLPEVLSLGNQEDYQNKKENRFPSLIEMIEKHQYEQPDDLGLSESANHAMYLSAEDHINDQIWRKVEDTYGHDIDVNAALTGRDVWRADEDGNPRSTTFADVVPRIHRLNHETGKPTRNGPLFTRAGDMLLPLAVGPWHDPMLSVGTAEIEPSLSPSGAGALEREVRWQTLSEALALGTGYYSPKRSDDPYNLAAQDNRLNPSVSAAMRVTPKLDRGHLVLDAWAPFLDNDTDGDFDPGVDVPLGNGIPLALNVLDRFRVSGFPAAEPVNTRQQVKEAYGSLTKIVPGVINLNTASKRVTQLVPLFTPENEPSQWMRTPMNGYTIHNPGDAPARFFDIASVAEAYRDKIRVFPRPLANPDDAPDPDEVPDYRGMFNGRSNRTAIVGIREEPGFKSVGEIMALVQRDAANSGMPITRDTTITRFAQDAQAVGAPALLSSPIQLGGGTLRADALVDDYEEQLTIANAALGSISVRSDLFCVWFLVHGYTPEDVTVGPEEALVPSVERRYMMIVDRSNVTSSDQAPRILLFKELPLP